MLVQDNLLIILNCCAYRHKAEKQKQTWLCNLPMWLPYYHVVGDISLETPFVWDEETRVLTVRAPDDYNSLPKKVMASLYAVQQTFPSLQYVWKTDDDQTVDNPTHFAEIVRDTLERSKPRVHYGGHLVTIDQPYLSEYYTLHPCLPRWLPMMPTVYSSGRFYVLSKQARTNLLSKRDRVEREYLEDYAVGYHLDPYFKSNAVHLPVEYHVRDVDVKQPNDSSQHQTNNV